MPVLAGTDIFSVEALTLRGLVAYYVLFFIHLESRKVEVSGITPHPNERWMNQIARNVTMDEWGFLDGRRYLIHDRDTKFTDSFRAIVKSGHVEPLKLPARSPNLNAYGDRAAGVDGVTKEQYGEKLEENLQGLSQRLRRMGYKPQAKRRSYIPKPGSEKGRPLGISCFEDKLVELALKRVLEPIYEPIFEASSYGYRPGCNQHGCLDTLGRTIQQKRVSHVVEADIKSFLDASS